MHPHHSENQGPASKTCRNRARSADFLDCSDGCVTSVPPRKGGTVHRGVTRRVFGQNHGHCDDLLRRNSMEEHQITVRKLSDAVRDSYLQAVENADHGHLFWDVVATILMVQHPNLLAYQDPEVRVTEA